MTEQTKSNVESYCEAWASSLALLVSQLSSSSWRPQPATDAGEYAPIVRVRVSGGNGLKGAQWLSFGEADIADLRRIAQQQDQAATTEAGTGQNAAIADLVQQWADFTAAALRPDFGKLSLQAVLQESSPESTLHARLLHITDGSRCIAALLQIDENLSTALDERKALPTKTLHPTSSARIEELVRQGNLGLLMDVELNVMLQFGCRQATLREVLELATGAVLELDREIQEPVDLLLNGRVIARGEVVVIDGNYGLRVTEVASAQQRVDSL